ncbi:helix-turn-helix domain-containing protein [Paenibacillus marchantiophytorum]|uniref:helix-turn-helix domain-containing protein n=1 Tax=Paenibacillus marchantiophytorum TaxID=1619310 RepID=UPI001665480E
MLPSRIIATIDFVIYLKKLIRHTNISIISIALECGFSTDAQFCTIFKREIGETPRAYRILRSVIT